MRTFEDFLKQTDPQLNEDLKKTLAAGVLGLSTLLPSTGCTGDKCPATQQTKQAKDDKKIPNKSVTSDDAGKFLDSKDPSRLP